MMDARQSKNGTAISAFDESHNGSPDRLVSGSGDRPVVGQADRPKSPVVSHENPVALQERVDATERPRSIPFIKQRWEHLLFLHWEVAPSRSSAWFRPI